MSTTVAHSKRHLDIDADEINADLNGTINTSTTAATQSTSDNSTKVSTTAFVKAQGYITTQSDTQDLSIVARTISLTDGGSVVVPAPTWSSVTSKPTTFAPIIGTTSSTAMAGNTTIPSISGLATTGYVDAKTWNGNDITSGTVVSARLDADTAHLSTTQTFTGAKTFSSTLVGTTASFFQDSAAGTNALNLLGVTNGLGVGITFSDNGSPAASSGGQNGYMYYYHADGSSYGSGNAFVLTSSEATTTILADGKLMYKEGIYSKPSSGTGAGTRKDANWDTAYTHSQAAHAPSNANNYIHPTTAGNKHIPTGGSSGQFLRYSASGTATWATPDYIADTNTTYSVGDGGLTQKNFTTTLKNKLDGIAASANNYVHPTTAGNKHVPTGGASGQFLRYSSSGTATWATPDYIANTNTHTHLDRTDNRTISPNEYSAGDLNFGFTSWGNNSTSPYADFLHLRSYTDSSGGADNMVMFKKSGIGMRIWQQSFGSSTAYSNYEDVWHTGNLTTTNKANYDTAYGWGNHTSGGYAPLASPTFTGTPRSVTPAANTNTTQIATTAYVQTELTDLIGGAPGTLNTLNELAAAINDDASYASTLTSALATKLPLAGGTMTGDINLGTGAASIKKTANTSGNYPAVEVYSSGTGDSGAAIAIQQATSEGDTIIFADYEPYVEWGISSENNSNEIHFTGGGSTNSLGSKTFKNNAGSNRTAYKKMTISLSSGNVVIGGTLSASGYNDSNWNTAYDKTLQWNGGATGLVAATGRTSLGLGTAATTASTAYATSAQGTLATNALPKAGGTMTGSLTMTGSPVLSIATHTGYEIDFTGTTGATNIRSAGTNMFLLAGTGKSLRLGSNNVNTELDLYDGNLTCKTNINPDATTTYDLGSDALRWWTVFCETLDSAGLHEKNLSNKDVGDYPTGTVLVWANGKAVPSINKADYMKIGIAVEGMNSPLVHGAEPVLCTGPVSEGDYLVTSLKEGHAEAMKRQAVKEQGLIDCVIGKALMAGDGGSHLVKTWLTI